MPLALQHATTLNLPHLGLVLLPGVETLVTPEQAEALVAYGVTILPDSPTAIPFHLPPAPALDEEHDR